MSRVLSPFQTSIGKKLIMATTGGLLLAYVVGHMVGNLQIFLGPEALNAYGRFLHEFLHGGFLLSARLVLLVAVLLHIWAAVSLARANLAARPQGYKRQQYVEASYASRTMIWSGPILAVFVVYHLLHLTTGHAHPEFVHGAVYENTVVGFQNWTVSAFYIVAVLSLGFHLRHGIWSMFQTLGANHPSYNSLIRLFSTVITLIIVFGFITVPVAVLTGIVK